MANDVLKLTWAADDEADQDSLNLLDFIQGLTLADNGWLPQVATGEQLTATETLTFRAQALSHNQLAGYVQVLDDWILKSRWTHDQTQKRVVWFNARWKSETSIRRAPVYSLSYSLGDESSPFAPYVRDDSFVPTLTLVIVRGAYWEDTTYTISFIPATSLTGGKVKLKDSLGVSDQSVTGDVPARLMRYFVTPSVNSSAFWTGFRSSYIGNLTNFVSLWELELSNSLLGGDTTVVADGTASNGQKITTTFAGGASLLARARIRAADVSGLNTEDQRGLYSCLLRAKMSDASIARVRAASGFSSGSISSQYIVNPRVTVQGTSWLLYDLGSIRLPAIDDKRVFTPDPTMAYASIELSAERVSGAGNLEMDCLILLPLNDSFAKVEFDANQQDFGVRVNPLESITAAGTIFKQGELEQQSWSLPAYNEAPLLIFAGQQLTAQSLTTTATVTIYYVRRWRTLRGNE